MKNTIEVLDTTQIDRLKRNLSKENIKKLFDSLCKHKKEYKNYSDDWDWSKCKDCVLHRIDHYVLHGFVENGVIKRDVCFAIWHDREFEQKDAGEG